MKNEKDCSFDNRAFQRLKSFRTSAALVFTTLMLVVATTSGAAAQNFKTLHSFDYTDGFSPWAGLVQATNGYLYGTTYHGGTGGNLGTVFQVAPSGKWKTLYSFDGTKGAFPKAGLVQDTNGILYGTTSCSNCGTVFKITLSGTLNTLHSFKGTDGLIPDAGLVQDTDGNLYGTTQKGGTSTACGDASGCGTIFKITPSGTLTPLYSFCSQSGCTDGYGPTAGLIQAADGNLYGTTYHGGGVPYCTDAYGCGTVFQFTPSSGKLKPLYSFCSKSGCTDGTYPYAGVIQATDGNFYGTTYQGGTNCTSTNGCGTVFQLTPSSKLKTLYSFCSKSGCTDGSLPYAGLIQATDGNFYGTTNQGGNITACQYGCGTVFQFTPSSAQLKPLRTFDGTDGSRPYAALVQDTDGNLYGTTSLGGASTDPNGYGTVFSLSVVGLSPFVETQVTSGKEGAKIGILGQGFSSSSVVKFGGAQATTIKLKGTTFITATAPAGALTGPVTVKTGTTTLTSAQIFRVTPTIISFAPPSGPVGTSVTITGTGLEQTTKVTFNGKSASSFTVDSDTQVLADVPSGATTGKIAITTKGGSATSSTNFTVN